MYETDTGEKVVYGTELHKCLGSKRQYTDWIKSRLSECEAIENEDFQVFHKNVKNRKVVDRIQNTLSSFTKRLIKFYIGGCIYGAK